jgi:FlaA1/EpsC-like NDP-sugar epimerase
MTTDVTSISRWPDRLRTLLLLVLDVAVVWVSTLLAYWVRFGGQVAEVFLGNVVVVAIAASILYPLLFWPFRLYHQVWRHIGVDVIVRLAAAVAIGLAILTAANYLVSEPGGVRFAPLGVLFGLGTFVFVGATGLRAFGRVSAFLQSQGEGSQRNVLIIGAGDAGVLLLRDMENQPELGMRAVGFLDDDPRKQRRFIRGVRVLGTVSDVGEVAQHLPVDEIQVAVPSATATERRRILDACAEAGVPTKVMQPLAVGAEHVGVSNLRAVRVEDLLGRKPVSIDSDAVEEALAGKVVLVTGAAGSIGSELCRQVARLHPARLLLVDIDESRLYETYLELSELDAAVPEMRLCDIRDSYKLDRLFSLDEPQIVLHAAAYKHVPLMQIAPDEAVKTNVMGTRNVLEACEKAGVESFVLISTDKAVAPSSVMGLSKAIAERLTLESCRRGLHASAVRFGNVLGSRGSVVPLFSEQLRSGGPVKVTHEDATRYFMTIPEAARLVLQAHAISGGGEIFVLEMGEPVKIMDLAQQMIALSGADAEVEVVGLRPAEKLHESLVHEEEDLLPSGAPAILKVNALPVPDEGWRRSVDQLVEAAVRGDGPRMSDAVARVMPGYRWLSE